MKKSHRAADGGQEVDVCAALQRLPPEGRCSMSNEPKDPNLPAPPQDWPRWIADAQTSFRDLDAVTKDQLRRKRKRDLGVREAKRLYRDASDQLARLLGLAGGGRGGGDDGEGGPPSH